MFWGVSHMWVAALEISVFVVGGLSAWYLYKKRHTDFFLLSFKWAVIAAVVITPLQIWIGDGSGRSVYDHVPTKLGAMEAHWQTNPPGKGAPFSVLAWPDPERQENRWSIEIPDVLSLLTTHTLKGEVRGLREFPREDQPPIVIPYYAFRVMVAIGTALFLLLLWTLWVWRKGGLDAGRISSRKWLLRSWMAALPLSYIAMETGWAVREVGRQPWVIYGMLRTGDSASPVPAGTVAASLAAFVLIYALLMFLFVLFARRIILKGPDLPRTEAQMGGGNREKE
jgi:cytochrome d ubiquinol oxidase subunit I